MKKIDLGQTLGILANVGVLGGLILVAFEIRQNTSATVSTAIQAVSELSFTANLAVAQDSELAAIFRESLTEGGLDRLTEDQQTQLTSYYVALIRSHQNRFQLVRLGIIDDEDVYSAGGYGDAYRSPFFLEFWRESRNIQTPEFRRWFERELGLDNDSVAQ